MDLFTQSSLPQEIAPLAERMRPRSLDEYIGQQEIIGPGKLLRRAIEADRLTSIILFGPPGTGKTSLAKVIAATTKATFVTISAVSAGVKELREVIEQALTSYTLYRQRTVVFCDEVHRFNKGQQDALLPAVENGTIIFIGATTENPYFEINSALLSRSTLFRLTPLEPTDVRTGLLRAIDDQERGYGLLNIHVEEAALQHWIDYAGGDLRRALNALELAVLTTLPDHGERHISLAIAQESIQQRVMRFDKNGDNHYDMISAMIKSMRGSDPDAALYWLAALIESGEDPRFLMRRILIHASEDVGLADPAVLLQAHAASAVLEWVGMPEARIPMAQAVLAIALAPKSNSVVASIDAALDHFKNHPVGAVPLHLRDASYPGAKHLGHGTNYQYPHAFPGHYVKQNYFPDEINPPSFYHPSFQGRDIGNKGIPGKGDK